MVAFAFYLFVAKSSSKTSVGCTRFALAAVVIVQGVLALHVRHQPLLLVVSHPRLTVSGP